MVSTLNELSLALSEGRSTAVQLTEAALARAQDEAGEGARVFTKLYAESALAQAVSYTHLTLPTSDLV